MPLTLDIIDPAILSELRAATGRWLEFRDRYSVIPGLAVEGSRSFEDVSAFPRTGRFVRIFAGQSIHASYDHLLTWALLLDHGPVPIYGPWTLLRGVIENALRCRWLMEPADAPSRVARGCVTHRDDQIHRGVFDRALGPGIRIVRPASSKTAEARVANLDRDRRLDRAPKASFEDPTSLAARFGIERAYRLASAYSHGKEWATGTTMVQRHPEQRANEGSMVGKMMANEAHLRDVTQEAVAAAAHAMTALEEYMWPGK